MTTATGDRKLPISVRLRQPKLVGRAIAASETPSRDLSRSTQPNLPTIEATTNNARVIKYVDLTMDESVAQEPTVARTKFAYRRRTVNS
jgi:hypothetical protein